MQRYQLRRWLSTCTLLVLGLTASPQAWSQNSTSQQNDQLKQQLDQLGATAQTNLASVQPALHQPSSLASDLTGVPTVPQTAAAAFVLPSASKMAGPVYSNGAGYYPPEEISPEKKFPDVRVTGFFHLDSARFAQSDESRAALGDIQDGTGFRRARLAATGNVSPRGSYMLEFDIAQAQARFVDVWGQVEDTPLGNLRIGRFRQPFGMTELTGVRELPLMERPAIFALSPFRQTGIMLSDTAWDERGTWAVSGFRTLSDNFGNVYGDSNGLGIAERVTWLLIDNGDCNLWHFGMDHSYIDPARNRMQLASQAEVFVGQQPNLGPGGLSVLPIEFVPPFVNTGEFNIDDANLFNLEGAWSRGQTVVQAEHRWSRIALPSGEKATVQGGYLTLRRMLTGEVIPYNRSAGVFGRVKPDRPLDIADGAWGAWELVGQLSTINLNPLFGLPSVSGPTGRLDSSTVGINWYWWDNAKCVFEWVNSDLEQPSTGTSVTNSFASRLQFDF